MTPSLPCKKCGNVDDLETVDPLGFHVDKGVLWKCQCGNTRAVEISDHIPQELVIKAMVRGEIKRLISRFRGHGKDE